MRHVSMSIFAAVLVSTATVTTASAQSHQRAAGDTLRFHQATKMSQTMASDATGEITQSMNSNARLVAAFGGGDTITAWIDSAASKASGPMGEIEPDMSTILNKKQVATLSSAGKLTIVSSADLLPAELAAANEMMPETIYGLEMNLPEGTLRKGVVWTDTVIDKSGPDAPNAFSNTSITRYEVVGDSTIGSRPVFVVESNGTADIAMTMQVEGAGTVAGKMAGTVKGRLYFSPQLGIVLRRAVTTAMAGTQELKEMGMTMAVSQKNEETTDLIQ